MRPSQAIAQYAVGKASLLFDAHKLTEAFLTQKKLHIFYETDKDKYEARTDLCYICCFSFDKATKPSCNKLKA